MSHCDPRAVMSFGVAAAAAGASGARPALVALGALAVWSLWMRLEPAGLAWRLGMLLSGFGLWLLAAPFAPEQALGVALRGFAVSASLLVAGMALAWTAPLALLQAARLPPVLVAFLAILAGHAGSVRDEAQRVWRVLLLRGAFDRRANFPAAVRILLGSSLASVLMRGERVADVLALRGFEGRIPGLPGSRWGGAEALAYGLAALLLASAAIEVLG